MTEPIEIPLGKKKISLLLFAALIFVACGIWIILDPIKFTETQFGFRNPETARIWGTVGAIFFSTVGIYGFVKLFDKKPGLIIDSNGITDNTNAASIGLIQWTHITGIRTEEIMSTKFLLIDVENPEKFLDKAKNGFRAKLMKANLNSYDTPISIASNALKYNFKELEKLIRAEFEKNKNVR